MKAQLSRLPGWVQALLGTLILCIPLIVWAANVNVSDFSADARTQTVVIRPTYTSTTITYGSATPMAKGYHGTIFSQKMAIAGLSATSTLAQIPYSGRLAYGIVDGAGSSQTLTCTGLTITGQDQFGRTITFFDNTITETIEVTDRSFEKVTKITVASCGTNFAYDANDKIVVRLAGEHVALPTPLGAYTNMISICRENLDDVLAGGATQTVVAANSFTCSLHSEFTTANSNGATTGFYNKKSNSVNIGSQGAAGYLSVNGLSLCLGNHRAGNETCQYTIRYRATPNAPLP